MTIALVIILNLVLATAVVCVIVGLLAWSVATQGRDHAVGSTVRIRRHPRTILSRQSVETGTTKERLSPDPQWLIPVRNR
jgi:hypothetical protein